VNVDRPALIPTGVDSEKPDLAVRVGDLVAAQKLLADRVKARIFYIRIDAPRIAMPDVHMSICQWLTIAGNDPRNCECQSQWRPGFDLTIRRIRANV